MTKLPANARRTTDENEAYRRLSRFHGISAALAKRRLHQIKRQAGRGADDEVVFDFTGNVFDPVTLELLGSVTEGGKGP